MQSARILIVEDEQIVAADLERTLRRLGYQVVGLAASGQSAVEHAQEAQPDLVLMDIKLKGVLDGVDAAAHIQATAQVPIIYLTAYADKTTLQRAKITEPFGYVLKPFEERQLHSSIEMALYKARMERQLRTQKHWLATTLQSMSDGVIATDTQGYVTLMNPQSEALTGWRQYQAAGKTFAEIFQTVPQQGRNLVQTLTARVLEQQCEIALSPDSILIARDGREVPIEGQASPMLDGQNKQRRQEEEEEQGEQGQHDMCLGVVCVFRDISERKQAEETLQRRAVALAQTNEDLRIEMAERKRAEEALQALSHRLLQAQEKERGEIARELHDEIGQSLTALKINLDSVYTNTVAAESTVRLADSLSIVNHLLQQVRDLSLDLRPSMLDDLGLVAALRWYIDRQAQRTGFTAEFVAGPLDPRPSPAIETVCFRIAQEAVTNIARHAQAQRVRIELRYEPRGLLLSIRDDGLGFDVQAVQEKILSTKSMGIRGMHERVQLVGGRVETLSVLGEGAEIRALFPRGMKNGDLSSEELA